MEIQSLLNKLTSDIEEKNRLLARAEAEHRDTSKVQMELDAAIENYTVFFNALPLMF